MINYDKYKNKIAKLAAVKNFVVRFRALFICAFALIVALISAFLITKGMVINDFSLSKADIFYGDSYEIQPAKALFSSVRYEFAPEDSEEWSETLPDKAGKYRVRTVTDKAFGTGYGKPLSFEIAPKPTEISIKQDSVVYGNDPSNFTCELVNGDTLSVVGFRFESFASDITNVCANADSVVITNKAGEDVTYCYALSTPQKEVKLSPKQVSFAPRAAEYVYGGAPLSYESLLDEDSEKQLAAGDKITVTTEIIAANGAAVELPENAGNYTVRITGVKIMNGNTDVTALYNWESSARTARITVARRAVTVQTASDSKEYDATPLVNANFTSENLAEGHTFVVTKSAQRTVVGTVKNEIDSFRIQTAGGEDVTDNYAVEITAGTLEITPKQILVTTESAEKAYDGKPLVNVQFSTSPSPVTGHTVAVSWAVSQITEVGSIPNEFEVWVRDEEGNSVTENYSIGYSYGDLVVKAQELKYTAENITRVYDGKELLSAGTITGGLAEGERVELDTSASAKLTNAGTVDNAPVFRIFRISDGVETTHNYTPVLEGERGKIKIEKRKVIVRTLTPDEAFEYDGGDHCYDRAEILLAEGEGVGLAEAERYSAVYAKDALGIIRNVGTQKNEFTVEFYHIVSKDEKYDVTENYDVVGFEYGTLTVTPRPLEITTGSKTAEYDGKPFSFTEGWEASKLATGQTLKPDESQPIASVTEVSEGAVDNVVSYRVFDEDGNDTTRNYTITYPAYGKISRTQRTVTLETKSASTPYDGAPMRCPEWENVQRLLDGDDFGHEIVLDETRAADFASITYGYDENGNQLTQENVLYFIVKDKDGKDITYNYNIVPTNGILTRTKRAMTVTTLSAEKIYDGKPLYGDDEGEFMTKAPVFDGLVTGERYETNSAPYVINVKREEREAVSVPNSTVYDYFAADGFKTTYNYEITTVAGELLIKPRLINITTSTVIKVYDGKWLYGTAEGEGENGKTVITNLVEGQSAVVIESSIPKIRDVKWTGEGDAKQVDGIENTTQFKIMIITESTTTDVTDNYDVGARVNGKLTVTPKAMTVTTLSAEKVYDAEPLDGSVEGEWTHGKPVFDGLVAGEIYRANTVWQMTTVKRDGNDFNTILTSQNATSYRFFAPLEVGGAVGEPLERETTGNYEITYVYGELKVTPREITVTTAGDSRPYDGTPLTKREAGDYTADNLVKTEKHTHTLALDTSRESDFGTVTDVVEGEVDNTLYVLVKEGDENVTSNYNISYSYGKLKIDPREIVVTTASASKTYDGAPLVKEDGFTPSWLFEEHELVLDESRRSEFGTVVNVADGEVDNKLYFKVQKKGGTADDNERANANYKILAPEEWGKLKITALTITVRTESKDWTYDGQEHEWLVKSCDEQEFLDKTVGDTKVKHVLVADETQGEFGKITNVWENRAKNNVQYYVVYPENYQTNDPKDNAFINQNYNIEYVYGDLVINERAVTITAITAEKTYDGLALRGDIGYGGTEIAIGGEGLANGEDARAIDDTITSITDVQFKDGAVVSVENGTQYKIYKGTDETTGNYTIKLIPGALKINQRQIALKTLTAEKVYDGLPLDGGIGYGENNKPIITGEGLASGEKYEVVEAIGIVNVLWKDEVVGSEIVTKQNLTTYKIVKADGSDSTNNYNIEKKYGTLKITPREIKYTTPTATHEYDGTEFFKHDSGYKIDYLNGDTSEDSLRVLKTHKLVPVAVSDAVPNPYSTITDVKVGEGGNPASIENVVWYRVVDEKGDDITANYLITDRIWGTLTVTPRRLQITTATTTWVYADTDRTDDGYTAKHLVKDSLTATDSAFTFVSGHTLETDKKTTVHDVCTDTPNVCTYRVKSGVADVSDNYKLTVVNGKLSVTKRPITITSGSDNPTYDGQAHKKLGGFTWTPLDTDAHVGLLENHAVLVSTAEADAPSITHFRENKKENNVLTFKIEKAGTDVTANYEVTTKYGTIAIEKAKITVVLTPFEPVKYNGSAVAYLDEQSNYVIASSTALQNGETLKVAVYFTKETEGTGEHVTPILAGTYYAHLDYDNCKIFAGSDKTDATDYDITAAPVELQITANELTVTTATNSREYNGDPYRLPEFTPETKASLPSGHTIVWDGDEDTTASVTNVKEGKVSNEFSYVIYDGDGKDVTNNFEITPVWGEISVTERTVTVVTASGTHEYDGEAFSYPVWEDNPAGLLSSEHGHYLEWDKTKDTASVLTVYDGEVTNTFFVVVKNTDGKDISSNYAIVYKTDGKIKITPRQIQVTVKSADKMYDGTKLVEKRATAKHLKNGVVDSQTALLGDDELVATGDEVSILNAYDDGAGINTYVYVIKNGETDVSDNYQIVKTIAGSLKINPLAVEVTLKDLADTVYGDTVSAYPAGTGNYGGLSVSLVSGETLEIAVYFTLNGEKTTLGKAGTYQIVLDTENCKIHKDDKVKDRGIENYKLTQKSATVTVEKRQVELKIEQLVNATKVYDGVEFDYITAFGEGNVCYTARTLNAKQGVFAAGETFEVELSVLGERAYTTLLHADKYTLSINLDNCTVVKAGDTVEDVSENYTLTVTEDRATYEITKRQLKITLVDDEREYDGTEFEYSFKEPNEAGYEINGLLGDSLLWGEFVYTGDLSANGKPLNAGSYTVTFKTDDGSWWISSTRTEPCKDSDYEIAAVQPATITIAKRRITVKIIDGWKEQYKAADFSFADKYYDSTHEGYESSEDEAEKAGFVYGDDAGKFSYEFKQNNAVVTPRNVGKYAVTVSFDTSLSANYEFVKNEGGTFEITPREITVVGGHGDVTYAAKKLGEMSGEFSFTSYLTSDSSQDGFLGQDADAFDAAYTVKYDGAPFAYTTDIIHGGKYGVSAALTVKAEQSVIAGNYTISYADGEFTVKPREIYATRDEDFTKVYDKKTVSTSGWGFFDWVDERGEEANGFLLDSERANASPKFVLLKTDSDEEISPIHVGDYRIKISGFTSIDGGGLIERDYTVIGGEAKLTIEQFLLIVKPKDYTGLNTGEPIALPEGNVVTYTQNEEGNGVVECTLPEGDSITVEGDATLDPGSKYVQAVYIKDHYLHGDDGIEKNYHVIKSYTGEDIELLNKLGIRTRAFFRGNLSCETLTVEIRQILKNEKYRTIVTDGSKYNIPLEDVDFELIKYADKSASITVAEGKYGLLEGHYAKVTAASVQKYPGVYKTWLTVKIYRKDGEKEIDVTKGYNIVYRDEESSYITVKEIELSFDILADMGALVNESGNAPANGEVVYLAGDTPVPLEKDKDFKLTAGKTFGKHEVEFKAVVEGGKLVGLKPSVYTEHSSGMHVSQDTFYDLDATAMRYSLYFTSGSATKVYDGEAIKCLEATASWILPGHSIVVLSGTSSQVGKGSVQNTVTYKIVDEANNNVEGAYATIMQYKGTLTVTARPIYVESTPSHTFMYNGTAQSYTEGFKLRASDKNSGLLSVHEITKISGTEVTLPTGSSVKNEITILEIKRVRATNNTNYIGNYEIIYDDTVYGVLDVTRRDVTVSVVGSTFEKEYDGTSVTLDITANGLLTDLGHKLLWNAISVTRPNENQTVRISKDMLNIAGNDGEVTQYYNIIVDGGERDVVLKINPRKLTVTSNPLSKTYDGIPLVGTASVTAGSVASGDQLSYTGSASLTNTGSLSYQLGCKIVGADGADLTESCYEISYVSGTLTVNKKAITVTSATLTGLVYGQTPSAPTGAGNYGGLSASLASGETLEVSYVFTADAAGQNPVSPKNAGTYYVWISGYTVYGGNADNYQFACTHSSFTIAKKTLSIALQTGLEKTYDGEAYAYEFVLVESGSLCYAGEDFRGALLFNGAAEAVDAGHYSITLGSWSVTDEEGVDVSGNYAVSVTAGSLTIAKCTVVVDLGSHTKEYDGEAFVYPNTPWSGALVGGDSFTADVVCTQNGSTVNAVEVGEYGLALENVVITGSPASNYNIVASGSLTVTEAMG